MTDKQIIIDGVDVSGCEFYWLEKDRCNNGNLTSDCQENKDCIYKRYIRKEQECEKLETARHLIEISRDKWEYRAKSKERECESLNRWLPIILRLETEFEDYAKAKAIAHKPYAVAILQQLDQAKAELELYKRSKQASYEEMQRRWSEVEQENRQLKRQHEGDKGLITSTGKMNYQLLQEYDKVKTENKRLKETLDELFKIQYKLADNNKKLRQCLTEIKEIAKKIDPLCIYEDWKCTDLDNTVECPAKAKCPRECRNKILQKISECEVENE